MELGDDGRVRFHDQKNALTNALAIATSNRVADTGQSVYGISFRCERLTGARAHVRYDVRRSGRTLMGWVVIRVSCKRAR